MKVLESKHEEAVVETEYTAPELKEKVEELEQILEAQDKTIHDKDKQIQGLKKELSTLQDEVLAAAEGQATVATGRGTGPNRATVRARGSTVRGGAARGAARGGANNARAQRLMETQLATFKSRNENLTNTVSSLEKDIADMKKAVRAAEAETRKAKESGGTNMKDTKKLEVELLKYYWHCY